MDDASKSDAKPGGKAEHKGKNVWERNREKTMEVLMYVFGCFAVISGAFLSYIAFWTGLKAKESLALWTFYATIFFVLTGAFVYFQKRLWDAQEEAARAFAGKRDALPVKRAELSVEQAEMLALPGKSFKVSLRIRNRGELTARQINLGGANSLFQPKTFTGPLHYSPVNSDTSPDLAPHAEAVLLTDVPIEITRQTLDLLKGGDLLFFYYGKGEYSDDSGTVYPIDFCFMYEPMTKTLMRSCPTKYWPKGGGPNAENVKWTDYKEDYFFGAIWRWKYRPEMGDQEPRDIFAYCADCERLLTYVREFAKKRKPDGLFATGFNCGNRTHKGAWVRSASSDPIEGIRDLIRKNLASGEWKAVVQRQNDIRNGRIPLHVSEKKTGSEQES
jgi:hypothetical protein